MSAPARQILLFGLPRSGTTWLGKIFDSHPSTLYRHEPDSVARMHDVPLLIDDLDPDFEASLRSYCDGIPDNRALKVVGKTPIFPKDYLTLPALLTYRAGVATARVGGRAGLNLPVIGAPRAGDGDCILVWKSIESLGRLGAILEVLPKARALHIVRHPCGFVASVERGERRNRFDDNSGASEDYNLLEKLLATRQGKSWGYDMADLRDMHTEERLAWRWAVFNDKAIEDTRNGSKVMSFAYERLCESPMDVAKDLLEFVGLAMPPSVERFVQGSTEGAGDATYYSVFKDPRKGAWGWREELDGARAERVIRIASRSQTWKLLDIGALSGG